MSDRCVVCSKEATKVCLGCDKALYCGAECSQKDWNDLHSQICNLALIEGGAFTNFVHKTKKSLGNVSEAEIAQIFLMLTTIEFEDLINDLILAANNMSYTEWKDTVTLIFKILFNVDKANQIQRIYNMDQLTFKNNIYFFARSTILFECVVDANEGILISDTSIDTNTIVNYINDSTVFPDKTKWETYVVKTLRFVIDNKKQNKAFLSEMFRYSVVSGQYRISRIMLQISLEMKEMPFYITYNIYEQMDDDLVLFELYCNYILGPVHFLDIATYCIERENLEKLEIVLSKFENKNNDFEFANFDVIMIFVKAVKRNLLKAVELLVAYFKISDINSWYITLDKAEKGDAESQFEVALVYSRRDDFKNALIQFKKAANQGHQAACLNLSYMYNVGFGVEQNQSESDYWNQKALAAGSANAMYNMFSIEYKRKDYKKASYWLYMSAKNNSSYAQHELGIYYLNGSNQLNIQNNDQKALYWLNKSAYNGYTDAQCDLVKYYRIKNDAVMKLFWCKKAAYRGSKSCMLLLSKYYYQQNLITKADFWATQAVKEINQYTFTPSEDEYWFSKFVVNENTKKIDNLFLMRISCFFGRINIFKAIRPEYQILQDLKKPKTFLMFAKEAILGEQTVMLNFLMEKIPNLNELLDFAMQQNQYRILRVFLKKLDLNLISKEKLKSFAIMAMQNGDIETFETVEKYTGFMFFTVDREILPYTRKELWIDIVRYLNNHGKLIGPIHSREFISFLLQKNDVGLFNELSDTFIVSDEAFYVDAFTTDHYDLGMAILKHIKTRHTKMFSKMEQFSKIHKLLNFEDLLQILSDPLFYFRKHTKAVLRYCVKKAIDDNIRSNTLIVFMLTFKFTSMDLIEFLWDTVKRLTTNEVQWLTILHDNCVIALKESYDDEFVLIMLRDNINMIFERNNNELLNTAIDNFALLTVLFLLEQKAVCALAPIDKLAQFFFDLYKRDGPDCLLLLKNEFFVTSVLPTKIDVFEKFIIERLDDNVNIVEYFLQDNVVNLLSRATLHKIISKLEGKNDELAKKLSIILDNRHAQESVLKKLKKIKNPIFYY